MSFVEALRPFSFEKKISAMQHSGDGARSDEIRDRRNVRGEWTVSLECGRSDTDGSIRFLCERPGLQRRKKIDPLASAK